MTDLVDGYLARKHNLITPLGVFLDPLADKLIITGAFIAFVEVRALHVPAWMVVAIVGREFLITGLRGVAATHGLSLAADDGGKYKTSVQNAAILTILVAMMSRAALAQFAGVSVEDLAARGAWAAAAGRLLEFIPFWMMFGATLVSVHTGVGFRLKATFRRRFHGGAKSRRVRNSAISWRRKSRGAPSGNRNRRAFPGNHDHRAL